MRNPRMLPAIDRRPQLLVLAAESTQTMLARALGGYGAMQFARTTRELQGVLASRVVDVVLIDACSLDMQSDQASIVDVVASQSWALPVVILCHVHADAFRATLRLMEQRHCHVVLQNHDELRAGIVQALNERDAVRLADSLLSRLQPELLALPIVLQKVVVHVVRDPTTINNLDEIAHRAGCSRRTSDRELRRSGLATAERLWRAARMIRAYCTLQRHSSKVAAAAIGCSSPKFLARQIRRLLGISPMELRRLTSDQLLVLLTNVCRLRAPEWERDLMIAAHFDSSFLVASAPASATVALMRGMAVPAQDHAREASRLGITEQPAIERANASSRAEDHVPAP